MKQKDRAALAARTTSLQYAMAIAQAEGVTCASCILDTARAFSVFLFTGMNTAQHPEAAAAEAQKGPLN